MQVYLFQTIVQDELEDRPSSATSSHSGVGSLRAESPAEIDGGHLPHTEEQGKREEIVAQTGGADNNNNNNSRIYIAQN